MTRFLQHRDRDCTQAPAGIGSVQGQRRAAGRHLWVVVSVIVGLSVCVTLLLTGAACEDRLAQAKDLEQKGDLTGALSLYQDVLAQEPDNKAALEAASVCLLQLKRYDEALVLEERLVALDSSNVQVRIELGFNYLNHQGRPSDAARVLGEAARLEPSGRNLTYLAQAQLGSGDEGAAEQTLRQAIDLEPDYPHAYAVLVGLLRGQGRHAEAQEIIDSAVSRGVTVADLSGDQ